MTWSAIFLLAIALAADAFSIGATIGLTHRTARQVFRVSFHFGLFQALMPLASATIGTRIRPWVDPWGRYLAFALLLFVGVRMAVSSFDVKHREDAAQTVDLTKGWNLIGLSVSVSIDALLAGFVLGLHGSLILSAVSIIGAVTFVLTMVGMLLARSVGSRIGTRSELIAGFVLVALGVDALLGGF
ncbi:MAG: manganese efflux pump [Deltaproteobacteria bacterium]|nr:manganese efflux pump [Deltaproteobacteria bacterium]